MISRFCKNCHKEFYPYLTLGTKKYCSKECFKNYYKKYGVIYLKIWRHKNGISKKYAQKSKTGFFYKTKEYKRLHRKRYKYNFKKAGELNFKTIQNVYEDNIKKYGTLTCYLCLNPIEFRKDHLEHKIPISRGGTNDKDNLDIACQKCNLRKRVKTVEEFKKIIEKERMVKQI